MLEVFSGYGLAICIGIASIFWLYLGTLHLLLALALRRARAMGYEASWAAVPLIVALEYAFPTLFPSHFAYAFFDQTWLLQIADLGGPSLVSALPLLVQAALYPVLRDLLRERRSTRARATRLSAMVGLFALFTAYGAYRTHEVDDRAAAAPTLHVGIVQAAMGVFEKRIYAERGHRRHLEGSRALEREMRAAGDPLDLLVWPESAYIPFITERTDLRMVKRDVTSPLLFGGVRLERFDAPPGELGARIFNTAYLLDANAHVQGTYDKTYLLAFGEYLPFGDTFPWLYELSPNTGHITPGNHTRPLVLGDIRITTLICYEDVLPSFTRRAVRDAQPHLMANITNDAWFGKSQEPAIHLAMARFRAAEHHRALVRSTNSGVSAFIGPAGRVLESGGLFTAERLHAHLPLMTEGTLYETLGDWPAYVALLLSLFMLARRREREGVH